MAIQPTYLADRAVAVRYGVNRGTVWRWARDTDFPDPVKIFGITRWRLLDIEKWEKQHDKAA
jgi:prophage regulatory protein